MSKDKAVDKAIKRTALKRARRYRRDNNRPDGSYMSNSLEYMAQEYEQALTEVRSQVIRDVVEVVKKGMCNYANCSDEDNNQYPDCKIYWDITHPANFVKSGCSIKRINDILDEIKSLEEVKQNDKNEESKTT